MNIPPVLAAMVADREHREMIAAAEWARSIEHVRRGDLSSIRRRSRIRPALARVRALTTERRLGHSPVSAVKPAET